MLWRGKRLQFSLFSHLKKMGVPPFLSETRKLLSPTSSTTEPLSSLNPWYTLAFLHNISTPLSILCTLVDDVAPDLKPKQATVLQATLRTIVQSTHLHRASLSGWWQRESFDVVKTTRALRPLLVSLAQPYQMRLVLPSHPIIVEAIPSAWEEILVNLVKNSRDSLALTHQDRRDGWISLTLCTTAVHWYLHWADSGSGLPEQTWKAVLRSPRNKTSTSLHGFGLRSVHFWWSKGFGGTIALHSSPQWHLSFRAPLSR